MPMATPSKKQLAVIRSQRSVDRSSATRSLGKIDTQFSNIDCSNVAEATVLIARLRQLRKSLTESDETVHLNTPDDQLDAEIEKSSDYADKLSNGIELLEYRVKEFRKAQTAEPPKAAQTPNTSAKAGPKFPKLELLKFDGDPLQWEAFWDDFCSSVDSRDDISTIDKFKLLRSVLQGEALRIVDGYLLTIANYKEVKDDLVERYGDKEVAIFAHLEKLLALPPASHDITDLRQVRDACETHIRSLVALGLTEETFGLVFTPILLSKLPKFVKMELYRSNGSRKWSLANLRTLLKDEIKARDSSERALPVVPEPVAGRSSTKARTRQNTASALIFQASAEKTAKGQAQKPRLCVFCQGPHQSYKCSEFPDFDSRHTLIKDRCLRCLEKGHVIRQCSSRKRCYYCGRISHHSSLCIKRFGKSQNKVSVQPSSDAPQNGLNPGAKAFQPLRVENAGIAHGSPSREGSGVMKTARATVAGTKQSAQAQIVFDDGSTSSFISSAMVTKIGAKPVSSQNSSVGRFGDKDRTSVVWKSYEVNVRLRNGQTKTLLLNEIDSISAPVQILPMNLGQYRFLADLALAQPLVSEPTLAPVDILVGLDYYYDFIGQECGRLSNGLVLLNSAFGYLVSGYATGRGHPVHHSHMLVQSHATVDDELINLERFWKIEELGIKDDPRTADDQVAQEFFDRTVKRENGRYVVRWPYKTLDPDLASTFGLSFGRLQSFLKHNKASLETFEKIFAEQISSGIIEETPSVPNGPVYYIPYHAVYRPQSSSTKIRLVYDASAKPANGSQSLNESLLRGPVLLNDLLGNLLRFRKNKIAMTSDVEKAFHMVGLAREDRDVTRFLWIRDRSRPLTGDNLKSFRFCRVPFGTVSSPFLLGATISHHLKHDGSPTAMEILGSTYVDNVLGGKPDVPSALEYYHEAKSLFRGASMNLRQWFTNCPVFARQIPDADRGQGDVASVLGLDWSLAADTLFCPLGKAGQENCSTKRQVLSSLASLFDPCGWFCPVTIKCRILMQELWKEKFSWDSPLPPHLLSRWRELQEQTALIPSVGIPRYVACDRAGQTFQLHCFADASKVAYAAAVYILVQDKLGQPVSSSLLAAKARVAPIKSVTIPRLELLASVLGAKFLSFITNELKLSVTRKVLWSDSISVVAWVSKGCTGQVFGDNRVKQIKEVPDLEVRYVPSEDNPADLPSRGTSIQRLLESAIWWHGPLWLCSSEPAWPSSPDLSTIDPPDLRPAQRVSPTTQLLSDSYVEPDVFDLKRFASLPRLFRVTSFVFRFIACCRKRLRFRYDHLTSDELLAARSFWEKRIQRQSLSLPLETSKRQPSIVRQLHVFRDQNDVLRCRGRLANSGMSVAADCPILLPKAGHFTLLVIREAHKLVRHSGTKHTLAQVRERYWIPSCRTLIKRVIRECSLCRLYDGGPFRVPDPPALPSFRVSFQRPFACVGLDYLGPLYVADQKGTVKVWICLFTCAACRAIHLEVAANLTANAFLLCLRRFVALYALPKLVVSDNATQFKAVDKTLQELWRKALEDSSVQDYCSSQGIAWRFITESAPWMGGFYERLVASVKAALRKCLLRRCVSPEQLQTLCYEISATLNSRPLVYSEDEAGDTPITPAHLLARAGLRFPDFASQHSVEEFGPSSATTESLMSFFRYQQKILSVFWKDWQNQYLLSLREYSLKCKQRNACSGAPEVGQVVLIKDSLPRSNWRLGRIARIFTSADGQCRSVELLLPSRKRMCRPIKLLYPIESSVTADCSLPSTPQGPSRTLPQRRSAQVARKRIRNVIAEEQEQ